MRITFTSLPTLLLYSAACVLVGYGIARFMDAARRYDLHRKDRE